MRTLLITAMAIAAFILQGCNTITVNVTPPTRGYVDQIKGIAKTDSYTQTNGNYSVYVYITQTTPKSILPIGLGDSAIDAVKPTVLK